MPPCDVTPLVFRSKAQLWGLTLRYCSFGSREGPCSVLCKRHSRPFPPPGSLVIILLLVALVQRLGRSAWSCGVPAVLNMFSGYLHIPTVVEIRLRYDLNDSVGIWGLNTKTHLFVGNYFGVKNHNTFINRYIRN